MNIHSISGPKIMGILNVTPDSFSDGGSFSNIETAVDHALRMVKEGADIIDIGGESTRPGAKRVAVAEQINRVIPVIRMLKEKIPDSISLSIDTTLSEVAEAAIHSGVSMVNDISAGREDNSIFQLAAKHNASFILMHMQGMPETMQLNPSYDNVVKEIRCFFIESISHAESAGVDRERIIIDPGIGFGKTLQHNQEIMAGLSEFVDMGYPILLGASRKRFLKSYCQDESETELIGATCATTVIGVLSGVKVFRVHDVKANRQAADLAYEIKQLS